MKIIFSLLSIAFSTFSFGQLLINNSKPDVYLDSNKIELEHFLFDQNKIEKFDIVKPAFDARTNTSGSIYITSQQPQGFNFLSYKKIKTKYFSNRTKPILLLLNGMFVKDPAKLNIDSSYISKIEVEEGEDYKELRKLYPSMVIVNVKLKSNNYYDFERGIYLNGLPLKTDPD